MSDTSDLTVDEVPFDGDSASKETIVAALVRLPEDVRTFVFERCTFVSDSAAEPPDAAAGERRQVTLPAGFDEDAVVHAVAHTWLSEDDADASENDVRELVTSWKFTGPGEDA